MKLTNNHNLPGPIYSKVAGEMRERPPGYGLTTLLRPPRMVALEIKHWGELESDAMDHVWRLFGSAIHQMIDVDNEQTILREHPTGSQPAADRATFLTWSAQHERSYP